MSIGDMMPPDGLADVMRRLRDLERQVREMDAARRLESASIGKGGIRVKDGGSISAEYPNGVEAFRVGQMSLADGTPIHGMAIRRPGGQETFLTYGVDGGGNAFWAFRDLEGNIVVSDDAVSGQGIARPWLPVTWAPSDYTVWPGTTNSAFAAICETAVARQQPQLFVRIRHTTDVSGTTGELRLMCNGQQLGSTIPVSFAINTTDIGPLPLPPGPFGDILGMSVDARRTAGTGAVRAMVTASRTQQS